MPDERNIEQIRSECTRWLAYHKPRTAREILADLAEFTPPEIEADHYGHGPVVEDLEAEVAALLGKPAALFMPSGTMTQQMVLRIWAERQGTRVVAFHPTCHLETHEQNAYRELHDLRGRLVGNPYRLMTLEEVKNIPERIGTLLLELPQREIGGVLPSWDELTEMTTWARDKGIRLHMDGARLWECKPFYGREYAEIAALFDTVYVSFYKILDGITGALLAGPEDIIAEARVWQRRHGGNLPHMYPFALAARKGLAEHLPRIPEYCAKAREVAAALDAIPEIEVTPNPPHTNMMHIYVRGDPDRLRSAALDIAEEKRIWLVHGFSPSPIPAYHKSEITIGEAGLEFSKEEIGNLFRELVDRAVRS